ncbi:MAG TPA: nitrogen regulation protein [Coxiellaceae bacterium]|nr:nitrogen regulation protein [Coxiellaceae bacterium]
MIAPLKISNRTFPVNLIQGPLAGVSCSAFRLLTWQYSKPAFSYSEMISANALTQNYKLTQTRFLNKDPNEGPVCFQLVGGTSKELSKAAKILTDSGADLIDFNCGCSVPKIYGNGAGSSLLMDRPKLYNLLCTLRQSTPLPLSVKIRVAINDEKTNQEIAKVICDAGVDCVVVHGRNWTEQYNAPCRHDAIRFFVEQMKIPVIGNGDVSCSNSLKKMFDTGCAGVMIARAGVGQPWLIGKLIAETQQKDFIIPTPEEVGKIFITHVEHLIKLLNNEKIAVLQARKLAKNYAKCLLHKKEFCNAINTCDDFSNFQNLCVSYFI